MATEGGDDDWRKTQPGETDDQAWLRRHRHIEEEKRAAIAEQKKAQVDQIGGAPDGVGI